MKMFTKFYDFSFFSFILLHIILPSFNYISMSTDEWSGGWPNQGVVRGGETLCSSCNLAKVYTRSRLNPLGILRQAATQTKPKLYT